MIDLVKATYDDINTIYSMQIISFSELLDKYHDNQTNPGAESLKTIIEKFNQNQTSYYLIQSNKENVGAIRIVDLRNYHYRISPMFILPKYQGKGYGQQALIEIEKLLPNALSLQLETIKQETKLCHLYQKMGFTVTGKEINIKDNMTIIFYQKIMQ